MHRLEEAIERVSALIALGAMGAFSVDDTNAMSRVLQSENRYRTEARALRRWRAMHEYDDPKEPEAWEAAQDAIDRSVAFENEMLK